MIRVCLAIVADDSTKSSAEVSTMSTAVEEMWVSVSLIAVKKGSA